jgi:segregation and condensation protein B
MDDLKNIIESLLFVAEEPLSSEQIKQVLSLADTKMIRQTLNELIADYEERQGAFTLHEVAGGYQFRSRPDYVPWIKRLLQPKPSRLSKAALETLAIIAYKQPMIRSDVEHLRGVDCGGVLRMLLERKLIRVLGRKEIPGRPLIYATTKQFLQVFDLKNLKDLPSPREIEALGIETMDAVDPEDDTVVATEPVGDTTVVNDPELKTENEDPDAPMEPEKDSTQKELDEEPPDSL